MTKRRRSYSKEFDHWVIAGIGDHQYNDGYDKWDEIVEAFNKSEEIILKRSHGDIMDVGLAKYWDLDKGNKKIYIGINDEDVDGDLKFNDKNFNVSIEYETLGDRIIGVNHIAMGNTFKQKCPIEVCKIIKQRGEEPEGETETPDVPDDNEVEVPEELEETETEVEEEIEEQEVEISNKIILEEFKLLKIQIEEMSKAKDELEPEPEDKEDKKKLKLGFQEKLKHDLPSKDTKAKTGFKPWKWIGNK